MVVKLGDPKGYLADDDRSGTWGKTPGDDAWRSWCGLGVQVVDLAGLDGPTQNNTSASGCQQGGDGGGQRQEAVTRLVVTTTMNRGARRSSHPAMEQRRPWPATQGVEDGRIRASSGWGGEVAG